MVGISVVTRFGNQRKFVVPFKNDENFTPASILIYNESGIIAVYRNDWTEQRIRGCQFSGDTLRQKNKEEFMTVSPYMLKGAEKDVSGKATFSLCLPVKLARLGEVTYEAAKTEEGLTYAIIRKRRSGLLNLEITEVVDEPMKTASEILTEINGRLQEVGKLQVTSCLPEDETLDKALELLSQANDLKEVFDREAARLMVYGVDDYLANNRDTVEAQRLVGQNEDTSNDTNDSQTAQAGKTGLSSTENELPFSASNEEGIYTEETDDLSSQAMSQPLLE
ncbi:MAG: hypothetical protein IJ899_13440 [Blautia sp.]|nr:hypothetical protein [Blautia sp.]